MVIETKVFGKIEIDDGKILNFESGIIGFPDLKKFAILFDEEKTGGIKWLQSLDEAAFAMPVMDPLYVKEDYNPEVDDDLLKPLGELVPDDTLVLVTVTVPKDLTKMSVNLQAPIVINAETLQGCQLVVEDKTGCYPVKFPVYDIIQKKKEGAGE